MLQFRTEACQSVGILSKISLIGTFEEGSTTRIFLENLTDWSVLSFNPVIKEACIQINSPSGVRVISLKISVPTT